MNTTNRVSFFLLPFFFSQVHDEQWVQASSSGSLPRKADAQPEPAGGEAGREWAQCVGSRPREAGLDLQHCTGIIHVFSFSNDDNSSYWPERFSLRNII